MTQYMNIAIWTCLMNTYEKGLGKGSLRVVVDYLLFYPACRNNDCACLRGNKGQSLTNFQDGVSKSILTEKVANV